MKEFSYYEKNPLKRRDIGEFTTYNIYANGDTLAKGITLAQVKERFAEQKVVKERIEDTESYLKARDEWYEAEAKLKQEFWDDCAEDFGLQNHPKREKLQEIAWEEGHSEGFRSVYQWYERLAELL